MEGRIRRRSFHPCQPTKRKLTAAVCSGKTLVVAGGVGEENTILSTVEVMDTDTWQWSTASSLPHPLSDATATVCGDRVYLLGLCDRGATSVFTCSLQSQRLPITQLSWHTTTDLPVKSSTCITLHGQLLTVAVADLEI